jgi:peptide/nickel transport system permease protein
MTVVTTAGPAKEGIQVVRRSIWRLLVRNPLTVASLAVLVIFYAVAILQPWIQPFPANHVNLSLTDARPFSGPYLLGGDQYGRDILSRIIASAPGEAEVTAILAIVSFVIGVTAGLIAGYAGRIIDSVLVWAFSALMAVPGVIVLIALYSLLGTSTNMAMAVFGILVSPNLFWMVRSLTRDIRQEQYVDAARVAGLSPLRIVGRHVLTAIRGPIILMTATLAGAGLAIQAGLQFLGLGDPTKPSWGGMLSDAFGNIYQAPLQLLWPAAAIGLVVGAFSLLSIGLRDVLEGTYVMHSRRSRRRQANAVHEAVAIGQAPGRSEDVRAEPAAVHDADASADRPPLLSVDGLRIVYPAGRGYSVAVQDISLRVDDGEIVGIVGESGSGKTQTVLAVLGLLPDEAIVSSGSIVFRGTELIGLSGKARMPYRGRRIAYIPQEPTANLDPSFRIGSQLVYGIRAQSQLSTSAARKLARSVLDRVGIRDPDRVLGLYPHQISGGMAQRVLIAGAIAQDPELLVADEPTTALDVTIQAEVLDLLRRLQKEMGMGVLIVTHNFGVVADICDRVLVMRTGQVVEEGAVQEVFSHPDHEYTQMLMSAVLDDAELRPELPMEA